MFNCPHTGVALAALEKLVARGDVKRSDRVVVISTATGLKFTDFKVAYHTADPAKRGRYANPPIELPNDYDARAIAGSAVDSRSRSPARPPSGP
jgi:threonine synthase